MEGQTAAAMTKSVAGHLSPEMFMQLLEGKANFLKNCGITVTMPSADAMAQASPDIINRFQAIKEVNFSGMKLKTLAGELLARGLPRAARHENTLDC